MDFKIPTKPYLKRYMHYRYPQPYRLSLVDSFGVFIYHIFRRQSYSAFHQKKVDKYTVKYSIKVGRKYLDIRGVCYLTNLSIVLFNNYVESVLREELYKNLEQCEESFEATKDIYTLKTSPFTIKAGIYRFLAKYNISTQELSYSTLQKSYYRYKLKKEKKLHTTVSTNKKKVKPIFGNIRLSA